ncbi:MAG: hypothetical protein KDK91_03190, partial [Gammaproteobacteria bacterium]|nr:hypothetical protein [Gammaproteobacteria bacterium]
QEGFGDKVDDSPTRGGREMIQLIISGQVDFAYSGGLHAKYPDQTVSMAAVTTKRLKTDPEIPTLMELGYEVAADAPTVVLFPKGTDKAIIEKMEKALKVAETDPDMIKVSEAVSYPINYMTAAEARALAERSWEITAKMIKATGYQPK